MARLNKEEIRCLKEQYEEGLYIHMSTSIPSMLTTIEAQQQEIDQLKLLQKKDGINILNVCRWWQDEFSSVPENVPCPRKLKELCPSICPKMCGGKSSNTKQSVREEGVKV